MDRRPARFVGAVRERSVTFTMAPGPSMRPRRAWTSRGEDPRAAPLLPRRSSAWQRLRACCVAPVTWSTGQPQLVAGQLKAGSCSIHLRMPSPAAVAVLLLVALACVLPSRIAAVTSSEAASEAAIRPFLALIAAMVLGALFAVAGLMHWLSPYASQRRSQQAQVTKRVRQRRSVVAVAHSPSSHPLRGVNPDMQMFVDAFRHTVHVEPHVDMEGLRAAMRTLHPMWLFMAVHSAETSGMPLLADGEATVANICDALRESARLRFVVLSTCMAGPLARAVSEHRDVDNVYVLCFTSLVNDEESQRFTEALVATAQGMLHQDMPLNQLDIFQLFFLTVVRAHNRGFCFGDPRAGVDEAEHATHAGDSPASHPTCSGCHPNGAVFGEVALTYQGVTVTSREVLQLAASWPETTPPDDDDDCRRRCTFVENGVCEGMRHHLGPLVQSFGCDQDSDEDAGQAWMRAARISVFRADRELLL